MCNGRLSKAYFGTSYLDDLDFSILINYVSRFIGLEEKLCFRLALGTTHLKQPF